MIAGDNSLIVVVDGSNFLGRYSETGETLAFASAFMLLEEVEAFGGHPAVDAGKKNAASAIHVRFLKVFHQSRHVGVPLRTKRALYVRRLASHSGLLAGRSRSRLRAPAEAFVVEFETLLVSRSKGAPLALQARLYVRVDVTNELVLRVEHPAAVIASVCTFAAVLRGEMLADSRNLKLLPA